MKEVGLTFQSEASPFWLSLSYHTKSLTMRKNIHFFV